MDPIKPPHSNKMPTRSGPPPDLADGMFRLLFEQTAEALLLKVPALLHPAAPPPTGG